MTETAPTLLSERTAEAIRVQYDGELPAPFAIDDAIPYGWVLDTRLIGNLPRRACRNCGLPVSPMPKRELGYVGGSSTGWTHDPGSVALGWQGVRCPGRITGALPINTEAAAIPPEVLEEDAKGCE